VLRAAGEGEWQRGLLYGAPQRLLDGKPGAV
jgi:hypothetical protein